MTQVRAETVGHALGIGVLPRGAAGDVCVRESVCELVCMCVVCVVCVSVCHTHTQHTHTTHTTHTTQHTNTHTTHTHTHTHTHTESLHDVRNETQLAIFENLGPLPLEIHQPV